MAGALQRSWPPDLFRSELVQSTEENRTRPAQGEENRACPTHGEEINELVQLIVRKKMSPPVAGGRSLLISTSGSLAD